jgi:fructose-bisphosphate aldolase class 1
LTADKEVINYLGGVILYEETLSEIKRWKTLYTCYVSKGTGRYQG